MNKLLSFVGEPLPNNGLTETERSLADSARHSFLSPWIFPRLFKNKNKELCDLLVVFGNNVFIFSDKNIELRLHEGDDVAWQRWYSKAVLSSARQILGAERWLKEQPSRVFLDEQATQPFHLTFPLAEDMRVYRIVVAHGSLSLLEKMTGFSSVFVGNRAGGITDSDFTSPFLLGGLNTRRGFVHILTEIALQGFFESLDTVSDFAAYLSKREELFASNKAFIAMGEETLLATYLSNINPNGEHYIPMFGQEYDLCFYSKSLAEQYGQSDEFRNREKRNENSYIWDRLIEAAGQNLLQNSDYNERVQLEKALRIMASAPREIRRLLGNALQSHKEKMLKDEIAFSVMGTTLSNSTNYCLLTTEREKGIDKNHYNTQRMNLLNNLVYASKMEFPTARNLIGIARDGNEKDGNTLILHINASNWRVKDQARAEAAYSQYKSIHKDRQVIPVKGPRLIA